MPFYMINNAISATLSTNGYCCLFWKSWCSLSGLNFANNNKLRVMGHGHFFREEGDRLFSGGGEPLKIGVSVEHCLVTFVVQSINGLS